MLETNAAAAATASPAAQIMPQHTVPPPLPTMDACTLNKIDELHDNATVADDANNNNNNNNNKQKHNIDVDDVDERSLQQLKAIKNKSNLFLIKSYSFIDRTNTKMSRATPTPPQRAHAKVSTMSAPDIGNIAYCNGCVDDFMIVVTDAATKERHTHKKNNKQIVQIVEPPSTNDNLHDDNDDVDDDDDVELRQLLRRPSVIHEYIEVGSVQHEQYEQQQQQQLEKESDTQKKKRNKKNDRPKSLPSTTTTSNSNSNGRSMKRESFLRQSLQSIRRSFGATRKQNVTNLKATTATVSSASSTSTCSSAAEAIEIRSASSVSTLANAVYTDATSTSMAPLQHLAGTDQCDTAINVSNQYQKSELSSLDTQAQHARHHDNHNNKCGKKVHKTVNKSLHHSYSATAPATATAITTAARNSLNPPVQSSSSSIRSTASSSSSGFGSVGGNNANGGSTNTTTAKQHEQQTTALASASTTTATGTAATGTLTMTPPTTATEKKRNKEVSSSRVKKFHRHFTQVPKDEKLINYFSCALVSDILLQGHLYITSQHFAFYSNVFGYVTKVVIPTNLVTKISKEKTAKIIPNAVGVATADERHVFGSFISRESAYRLMCSVCPAPLMPPSSERSMPKSGGVDVEISEECSIEDDSSCSISGNESSPQAQPDAMKAKANAAATAAAAGGNLVRRTTGGGPGGVEGVGNACNDTPKSKHSAASASASAPSTSSTQATIGLIIAGNISSSSSTSNTSQTSASSGRSTTSSPTTVVGSAPPHAAYQATYAQSALASVRSFSRSALLRLPLRTELQLLYVGVMLAIMLALFSVFLLYRILDIEAKTTLYNTPVDFNWRNDEDIFAEALRWQKELQAKSTEEAQNILTKNLEQISKVRRSLETLSMLIHDRSSVYGNPNRDNSD